MWGCFVKLMFVLSCSLTRGYICKFQTYDFGHMFWCYLIRALNAAFLFHGHGKTSILEESKLVLFFDSFSGCWIIIIWQNFHYRQSCEANPAPSAIKNYCAFFMIGIKDENNFTLQFVQYWKSVHEKSFIIVLFKKK